MPVKCRLARPIGAGTIIGDAHVAPQSLAEKGASLEHGAVTKDARIHHCVRKDQQTARHVFETMCRAFEHPSFGSARSTEVAGYAQGI